MLSKIINSRLVLREGTINKFSTILGCNLIRLNSNESQSMKVSDLIKEKRKNALLGGGVERIKAQHKKVNKYILRKIWD